MSHGNNKGFTIIELMLAMMFIGVLMVAIAMTTIQLSNIYTKGLTLREVNQAGRTISEELRRGIASSSPFEADPAAPTSKYIVRQGGGRLCLGRYTYVWNYGSALTGGTGAPAIFNKYQNNEPVRFAKVNDSGAALCTNPDLAITRAEATEMLSAGDRDLVVHSFALTRGASDATTSQALYSIKMIIGTNDKAQMTITSNDASCKAPTQGVGNEDYCAVNIFEIVARAGNKAGGGE